MASIEDTDTSSLETLLTKTMQKELNNFFKRRLLFWGLRWGFVFLVIRSITNSYPKIDWLWWVGGISALLSLSYTIISDIASIKRDKAAIRLGQQYDDENV